MNNENTQQNLKSLKAWAEKLNTDKKFAEKFKNLESIDQIVSTAQKQGYDFTTKELIESDLLAVSGGAGTTATGDTQAASAGAGGVASVATSVRASLGIDQSTIFQDIRNKAIASGENSIAQANATINVRQSKGNLGS